MSRFVTALIAAPVWEAGGIFATSLVCWLFQGVGMALAMALRREVNAKKLAVPAGSGSGTTPPC